MYSFKGSDCLRCKGAHPSLYCGKAFCPLVVRANSMFKVKEYIGKENFFGSSPAPFVGRFGYPDVNVGILSPPEQREDAWLFDAPRTWSAKSFQIPQIVDYRSALINSRFTANVRSRNKLLEVSQEVGMASKPTDVEISLTKKPFFRMSYFPDVAPMGPTASLKSIEITSNPKIDVRVEKVFSDTDLKARDALLYLYSHNFDEGFLTRLLSVATIGLKPDRRFVPTRWSITAVDDILGKDLIRKVKGFGRFAEYSAYFGSYLGNYYLVLLFPEVWSYELFEMYQPRASWNVTDKLSYMTDNEGYDGRKDYASNCEGGYYAARLPILEKLNTLGRQASVLAIRVITGEYAVPLGVWVVREAVRKAMEAKPIVFASKELMLKYAELLINRKFSFGLPQITENSKLIKNLKSQKKLADF